MDTFTFVQFTTKTNFTLTVKACFFFKGQICLFVDFSASIPSQNTKLPKILCEMIIKEIDEMKKKKIES